MVSRPVYLDHHATTPVDPRVLEAMLPYFTENFGNAASVNHPFGWEAAEAVDHAREQVARALNVPPRCLVFTSGATEANNLAIKGILKAAPRGSHLITNVAEHRAILDPARKLARTGDHEVTFLPVDEFGRVAPEQVAESIRDNTVLVSVMFANNEIGTINAVAQIGTLCRERNVLFHCDAVQAVGRIPLDLAELPIDLLSLSAHKLYGPKGIGALFVRRGRGRIRIDPLIDGGGHEGHLRSGTLAVPLIVGFGVACELAVADQPAETARIRELRDRLWDGLQREVDGLVLNGHPEDRLAHNLNISVAGVDGDALMMNLNGIAVSSGSACTSANPEPSHVLRAIGRSDQLIRSSLRFGLGRFNTESEVDLAIQVVSDTVRRLRKFGNPKAS